jgi:hypothetical protein
MLSFLQEKTFLYGDFRCWGCQLFDNERDARKGYS